MDRPLSLGPKTRYKISKSLHIPVEYLYAPSENISVKYEKPDLSPSQLAVFQKYFKMDIIMYEMAETKLGIRVPILMILMDNV